MTTIFELILCLLDNFVAWVAKGAVIVVNLVIQALGASAGGLVAALPVMPTFPSSDSGWWGWLNYFLPVASVAGLVGSLVTIWAVYYGVRVGLRWLKGV